MFYIIVVEPKYEGNIGAIARVMKNFGFKNLILVNPCEIKEDAYKRAMHSTDILEKAKIVKSFDNAIKKIDYIVGTTGVVGGKSNLRSFLTPRKFSEKVKELRGNIGLIFGREDIGLLNEELKKCDIVVNIPTAEYPIMNLSHAVAIVLYELFISEKKEREQRKASFFEKKKLFEKFENYLLTIDYPKHKKEKTETIFKRVIGRAMLSELEFYTLMGVFGRGIEKIKKK